MKIKRFRTAAVKPLGFTIVELMVATAVFAVVLLIFLSAFLQIGRLFYKGVNESNTQEAARTIIQDISDDINFSHGIPTVQNGYFCIGLHEYRYMLGNQVGGNNPNPYDINSNYGLVRQNIGGGCPAPTSCTPSSNCEEILSSGMQLNKLDINTKINNVIQPSVLVVFYGGNPNGLFATNNSAFASDPWKAPDAQCTGALASTQYCVTASYTSTVLQSF